MKDWLVPVVVAVIAAAATVIAGYLGSAKDRRNERGAILLDIEIAEKLPDGPAKRALDKYIADRTIELTAEKRASRVRQILFLSSISAIVVVTVGTLIQRFDRGVIVSWQTVALWVMGVVLADVTYLWVNRDRDRMHREAHLLAKTRGSTR